MTFFEKVWREAAETFGKQRGFKNPLSPYTRTWRLVVDRAEHALRVWDEKYGPLNRKQWDYAGDLVAYSLKQARTAPDCNAAYAFFNTTLTSLLNHERTDEGFTRRADSLDDTLGSVIGDFAEIPA